MSGVSTTANNAIKLLTRDFYVKKIVMRGSILRCCCYHENNHNVYREKRLAGIGEADVHADAKYLNADSIAAYLKLAMQQLADDLKSQSC